MASENQRGGRTQALDVIVERVRAGAFEFTLRQCAILRIAACKGPLPIGAIARELAVDPVVVTRGVATLERQGHLTKIANPHDRRSTLVKVTRAGESEVAAWHRP